MFVSGHSQILELGGVWSQHFIEFPALCNMSLFLVLCTMALWLSAAQVSLLPNRLPASALLRLQGFFILPTCHRPKEKGCTSVYPQTFSSVPGWLHSCSSFHSNTFRTKEHSPKQETFWKTFPLLNRFIESSVDSLSLGQRHGQIGAGRSSLHEASYRDHTSSPIQATKKRQQPPPPLPKLHQMLNHHNLLTMKVPQSFTLMHLPPPNRAVMFFHMEGFPWQKYFTDMPSLLHSTSASTEKPVQWSSGILSTWPSLHPVQKVQHIHFGV